MDVVRLNLLLYFQACAPRYVYLSTQFNKREPVGTCYLARSGSTTFEEYSPCRGSKKLDVVEASTVQITLIFPTVLI